MMSSALIRVRLSTSTWIASTSISTSLVCWLVVTTLIVVLRVPFMSARIRCLSRWWVRVRVIVASRGIRGRWMRVRLTGELLIGGHGSAPFRILFGLASLLFEFFLVKAPLFSQLGPIFNTVSGSVVAQILLNGQVGEFDRANGLWWHIFAWPVRVWTKNYATFVLFPLVFTLSTFPLWTRRSWTRSRPSTTSTSRSSPRLSAQFDECIQLAPNFEVSRVQFALQVHRHALVRVRGCLKSPAHLTHLHQLAITTCCADTHLMLSLLLHLLLMF